MARLTAEERAQLQALNDRAKAEEEEDADFVVRARNSKGIEVEYTGARARAFLKKHGFEDDEPDAEEGDGDEDEHDDTPDDKGGYFARRTKAKG